MGDIHHYSEQMQMETRQMQQWMAPNDTIVSSQLDIDYTDDNNSNIPPSIDMSNQQCFN